MITVQHLLLGVQTTGPLHPELPAQFGSLPIHGASVDSRTVEQQYLFVPVPSAHGDGHDFIAAAAARGARAILVKRSWVDQQQQWGIDRPLVVLDPDQGLWSTVQHDDPVFIVLVDDPAAALYRVAQYHRSQQRELFMIGITGDIGKAGTRQVLAAMLKSTMQVCKRPPSATSLLQIAAALLELEPRHQAAVFDFRANDQPQKLMELLQPQILILTNISQNNELQSMPVVLEPYQHLLACLPEHHWAILNIDDAEVRALSPTSQTFWYGLDAAADLWADQIDSRGLDGISFAAHYDQETWHIKLPLIGLHSVHTALAAASVGLTLGVGWEAMIDGLRSSAQLRLLSYPIVGGAILIDDSYNAAPLSGIAALNMVAEFKGRHIGVFGTLDTIEAADETGYRAVGSRAADVLDTLFVVGQHARWIGEEAIARGMPAQQVIFSESHTEVITQLKTLLSDQDIVLVKGARAAALDDIVVGLQVREQEERA